MPSPEPATVYQPKPVDELPSEDDIHAPRVEWEKVTEFRGSIDGAHVNNNGELTLRVKVPYEDKYLALPVTDTRSVLMVFAVFKPVHVEGDDGDLDAVWKGDSGGG